MPELSKTTNQALSVLLRLGDEGPMTASAVAQSLGLNRTVTHRLLTTLHQRGFVTKQRDGYTPGAMLLRIAQQVEPELRVAARAVLNQLAAELGETIALFIADGGDALLLDLALSREHALQVECGIGSRDPIDKTASGWAMLAFLNQRSIDDILEQSDDAEELKAGLDRVRALGYAVIDEQQEVHELAVPIIDRSGHAIGSLGMIVPTGREAALRSKVEALVLGADTIASSLTSGLAATGAGPRV